jgi:Flp pilus assembly CpaE family ATPase
VAALYCTDQIFLVGNPDVPSVRNAQRVIERVRELGACGERVRLLMNRATGPCPVPLKQIEKALGYQVHHVFPSDFKTVSTALNAGVPLALTGDSEIATQFDQFTRRLLDPSSGDESAAAGKRGLSLDRIASIW